MEMTKRHYGKRDAIKKQSDVTGEHFHHHAIETGCEEEWRYGQTHEGVSACHCGL